MNIFELSANVRAAPDKSGTYPIHINSEGVLHVYLMVPSDAKYGGLTKQLGKGQIDSGENPLEAAEREANEELGLLPANIKQTEHLHTEDRTVGKRKDVYTMHVYVTHLIQHDAFDEPGYESGWAGWCDIDTAIRETRKDQTKYLQMVKAKYGTQELEEAFDPAAIQKQIQAAQTGLDHYLKQKEEGGDPYVLNRAIKDTKAEISHLNSQIEIATDHGLDPLSSDEQLLNPNRAAVPDWIKRIAPALKVIKEECQPYLKQINSNVLDYPLFRGMKGTQNKSVLTGRVRLSDRNPAGSSEWMHGELNTYFKAKFGEEFRNAMFVSSDPDFAKDYGDLYLIFPRGEFTYLWSPVVKDLFDHEGAIVDAMDEDSDEKARGVDDERDLHGNKLDTVLDMQMQNYRYTTEDLAEGIATGHEIMIRVPVYYGINLTTLFERDDYADYSKGDRKAINTAIEQIQKLL